MALAAPKTVERVSAPIDPKMMLIALRDVVQRAIITLMVIRDPDARYHGSGRSWCFDVVRDYQDAYGYSKPRVRQFEPTPIDIDRMEIVAVWLAWIRRGGDGGSVAEGERNLRRLISWALAVPMWRLASRENCSERTVRNRIDQSLNDILVRFGAINAEVEVIDEPYQNERTSFRVDVGRRVEGVVPRMHKVWIDGIGYMIDGRRHRDGTERVDAKKFA